MLLQGRKGSTTQSEFYILAFKQSMISRSTHGEPGKARTRFQTAAATVLSRANLPSDAGVLSGFEVNVFHTKTSSGIVEDSEEGHWKVYKSDIFSTTILSNRLDHLALTGTGISVLYRVYA